MESLVRRWPNIPRMQDSGGGVSEWGSRPTPSPEQSASIPTSVPCTPVSGEYTEPLSIMHSSTISQLSDIFRKCVLGLCDDSTSLYNRYSERLIGVVSSISSSSVLDEPKNASVKSVERLKASVLTRFSSRPSLVTPKPCPRGVLERGLYRWCGFYMRSQGR